MKTVFYFISLLFFGYFRQERAKGGEGGRQLKKFIIVNICVAVVDTFMICEHVSISLSLLALSHCLLGGVKPLSCRIQL